MGRPSVVIGGSLSRLVTAARFLAVLTSVFGVITLSFVPSAAHSAQDMARLASVPTFIYLLPAGLLAFFAWRLNRGSLWAYSALLALACLELMMPVMYLWFGWGNAISFTGSIIYSLPHLAFIACCVNAYRDFRYQCRAAQRDAAYGDDPPAPRESLSFRLPPRPRR